MPSYRQLARNHDFTALWIGATVAWSLPPERILVAFQRAQELAAIIGLGIVLAGAAGMVMRTIAIHPPTEGGVD